MKPGLKKRVLAQGGSRDTRKAGKYALRSAMQSFSSVATMFARWSRFCTYLEANLYLPPVHKISKSMVQQYGDYLAEECRSGRLSAATAQNYLSAVNRVLEIVWGDKRCSVSPVQQAKVPRRTGIAQRNKSISQSEHERVMPMLSPYLGLLMGLQREFGLRFEESAKLDAVSAIRGAEECSVIEVVAGTKGGRSRCVPIVRESQLATLRRAADAQKGRSLIPPEMSYKNFRSQSYNQLTKISISFHGQRHWYAQRRYRELCGADCPVVSGHPHGVDHIRHLAEQLGLSLEDAKIRDATARETVAAELGHNRAAITNSYLG